MAGFSVGSGAILRAALQFCLAILECLYRLELLKKSLFLDPRVRWHIVLQYISFNICALFTVAIY